MSFDPRTGRELPHPADSSPAALEAALTHALYAGPSLANLAPSERAVSLGALAQALEAERDELAVLADQETALGLERLSGEVTRTANQIRFYAEVAAEGGYLGVRIDEATATAPKLVRANRPLGPVAVFGASNFPFAFGVLGNDTASAVAAGCPVVAKAHPAHPQTSVRLAEIAEAALPPGWFGLVSGFAAGTDLVRHEAIAAVAFTGSQAGGLALWRLANERPRVIPVFAEMGTVNPAVLTPAAVSRLAEVAKGFVGSFTLGAGQFCTKPGLLLAPAGSGAADAVATALTAADPSAVMLTRSIADGVQRGIAERQAAGATVVATSAGPTDGWSAPAAVLKAPISALVAGSPLLEECFGPLALVVEYDDQSELDRAIDVLQPSLAATVVTGGADDPDAAALIARLTPKVGRVTVDDWPTGVAFSWAQTHGGPWPATSAPQATSVGAAALDRFVRPVTWQSTPDAWLPPEVRADNPWRLPRRINGVAI